MEEKNIHVWQAKVLANEPKAHNINLLTLSCSNASEFKLGQFVCLEPLHPGSVMARPFSVFAINSSAGTISLLYKIVGNNTREMQQKRVGQEIKAWGPLGRPFAVKEILASSKQIWLVAGGIGIAAIYSIYRQISLAGCQHKVFYGVRNQAEIVELNFGRDPLFFATEDGSYGYQGFVSDLVQENLPLVENVVVLACGPKLMLRRVAEICANQQMPCWVCLERTLACGLGVCLGCTIQTTKGQKQICTTGPWYPAEEVSDELQARS